jgi:hypothetical protein
MVVPLSSHTTRTCADHVVVSTVGQPSHTLVIVGLSLWPSSFVIGSRFRPHGRHRPERTAQSAGGRAKLGPCIHGPEKVGGRRYIPLVRRRVYTARPPVLGPCIHGPRTITKRRIVVHRPFPVRTISKKSTNVDNVARTRRDRLVDSFWAVVARDRYRSRKPSHGRIRSQNANA